MFCYLASMLSMLVYFCCTKREVRSFRPRIAMAMRRWLGWPSQPDLPSLRELLLPGRAFRGQCTTSENPMKRSWLVANMDDTQPRLRENMHFPKNKKDASRRNKDAGWSGSPGKAMVMVQFWGPREIKAFFTSREGRHIES